MLQMRAWHCFGSLVVASAAWGGRKTERLGQTGSWAPALGPHKVLGVDGEQRIRADTDKHYRRYERLGNRILNNFVQFLKAY